MKFTFDISATHQKVKRRVKSPQYIQVIKSLDVSHYTTFVSDGITSCFCKYRQSIHTVNKYSPLIISEKTNPTILKKD